MMLNQQSTLSNPLLYVFSKSIIIMCMQVVKLLLYCDRDMEMCCASRDRKHDTLHLTDFVSKARAILGLGAADRVLVDKPHLGYVFLNN